MVIIVTTRYWHKENNGQHGFYLYTDSVHIYTHRHSKTYVSSPVIVALVLKFVNICYDRTPLNWASQLVHKVIGCWIAVKINAEERKGHRCSAQDEHRIWYSNGYNTAIRVGSYIWNMDNGFFCMQFIHRWNWEIPQRESTVAVPRD